MAGAKGSDITLNQETIENAFGRKASRYDKGGEEHYNIISAFIKSMRGSDPNASIYWLARMIEAGEDPVGGHVGAGHQWAGLAFHHELDGQPRVADVCDQ